MIQSLVDLLACPNASTISHSNCEIECKSPTHNVSQWQTRFHSMQVNQKLGSTQQQWIKVKCTENTMTITPTTRDQVTITENTTLQKRMYSILVSLLIAALISVIVTWIRYRQDVSEALAAADTHMPRTPLHPSTSKQSKKDWNILARVLLHFGFCTPHIATSICHEVHWGAGWAKDVNPRIWGVPTSTEALWW